MSAGADTPAVIINADDFGLSPGVNRGIVSAFREGVLTSTTMLVNLDHFDAAVMAAKACPELPVGIHLSLLWGRPVSDPSRVPSLIHRPGYFPRSAAVLARRYFLGRLSDDEVRTEFRAQIRKFLESGLTPTHVDTHKHIHSLPGVLEALADVVTEFGIRRVRMPYEEDLPPRNPKASLPGRFWKDRAKQGLIRLLCRNGKRTIELAGLRSTDHFVGISYMARFEAVTLEAVLKNLRSGVTEIMCHPGYADEKPIEFAGTALRRERELEALKAQGVKRLFETGTVRPTNFRDL